MVTKAELGVMKLREEKSAEGALHNSHVQLYTPIGKTCGSREYNSPKVILIVSHVQSTSLRPGLVCIKREGLKNSVHTILICTLMLASFPGFLHNGESQCMRLHLHDFV